MSCKESFETKISLVNKKNLSLPSEIHLDFDCSGYDVWVHWVLIYQHCPGLEVGLAWVGFVEAVAAWVVVAGLGLVVVWAPAWEAGFLV